MFNLLSSLLWQELWVLKDFCKSTINLGLGIEWTNKRAFLVAQWYPPANARDMVLIPGSGRSPGEGNGYPLQHSCLGNPMDRGVCQAMVQRVRHNLATKTITTTTTASLFIFAFVDTQKKNQEKDALGKVSHTWSCLWYFSLKSGPPELPAPNHLHPITSRTNHENSLRDQQW